MPRWADVKPERFFFCFFFWWKHIFIVWILLKNFFHRFVFRRQNHLNANDEEWEIPHWSRPVVWYDVMLMGSFAYKSGIQHNVVCLAVFVYIFLIISFWNEIIIKKSTHAYPFYPKTYNKQKCTHPYRYYIVCTGKGTRWWWC